MTRQHEKNNTASAAVSNSQKNSPKTLTMVSAGWKYGKTRPFLHKNHLVCATGGRKI